MDETIADRVRATEDALAALGNTFEEVANALLTQGVKGRKGCAGFCPIAEYIKTKLGYPGASATQYGVYLWIGEGENIQNGDAKVPAPVADFIHFFDKGMFPQLEKV